MIDKTNIKMTAKTFAGLEEVLAKEIKAIGGHNVQTHVRAVTYEGDLGVVYKSNLKLRTALRILLPIHTFEASDKYQLYDGIQSIDWSKYFNVNDTFAIDSVVNSEFFNHANFAALKAKDAIVDQFRDKEGIRPSVDIINPALRINLHIFKNRCTISLDSSNNSLHKRGYREKQTIAPLNEVLAAGMILLSEWDGKSNFMDPMCGSGTILIEAAYLAHNIAPGKLRKFGFQSWKNFDSALWDAIKKEAENAEIPYDNFIIGSDISMDAIHISAQNAKKAGLAGKISLEVTSFEDQRAADGGGVLITNPPYGERIKHDDIIGFYKMVGDVLKAKYESYTGWVLSSNLQAMKFIGLKPSRKINLMNGSLDCKFQKYEMYKGSKKQKYSNEGI